jgi:hypothetical protein
MRRTRVDFTPYSSLAATCVASRVAACEVKKAQPSRYPKMRLIAALPNMPGIRGLTFLVETETPSTGVTRQYSVTVDEDGNVLRKAKLRGWGKVPAYVLALRALGAALKADRTTKMKWWQAGVRLSIGRLQLLRSKNEYVCEHVTCWAECRLVDETLKREKA